MISREDVKRMLQVGSSILVELAVTFSVFCLSHSLLLR